MQNFYFRAMEDGNFCVASYEGDEAEVVIPENYSGAKVTTIFDRVFEGHREITSVKIPNTVTDLGEFIFDGCINLRQLDLPESINCLWGYTFVRCGLEEIVLPENLTRLPCGAFKECKNLKKVVCGKRMKKIYSWVFEGCENLEEVIYEEDVDLSPDALTIFRK